MFRQLSQVCRAEGDLRLGDQVGVIYSSRETLKIYSRHWWQRWKDRISKGLIELTLPGLGDGEGGARGDFKVFHFDV